MTLNTRIWLHGRISGEAAFRLALAACGLDATHWWLTVAAPAIASEVTR